MPIDCKTCGTSNDDKALFCAACGSPTKGDAPMSSKPASPPKNARAKTMIFANTAQPPQAHTTSPDATAVPNAAVLQNKRTVLGAPAVQLPNTKLESSKPPASGQAPMIKIASPSPNQAVAQQPAPVIANTNQKNTEASQGQPSLAKPIPSQSARAANRAKTMLGIPAVKSHEIKAALEGAQNRKNTISKPTEKGQTAKIDPVKPQSDFLNEGNRIKKRKYPQEERPSTRNPLDHKLSLDADEQWFDDEQNKPPKKHSNAGIIVAIAAAALVILALILFIAYKFILQNDTIIHPRILPSPDGEHLAVILDLPNAAPGATVQIQHKNIPINDGKVQFLLPKAQMVLGPNLVKLTITEPQQFPEEISFPVTLRHIATTDLSGLTKNPPTIKVEFVVATGYQLRVNGDECALINKVCTHRIDLSEDSRPKASANLLQIAVPFEIIDATGKSDAGQHFISVPITALQIDRPAPEAVVDSSEIVISGSSTPAANVAVNGRKIDVGESGFVTTVPLKTPGPHTITIAATAPGAAPTTQTISVTKVDDLTPYVQSWAQDLDKNLNFAKLSRETLMYTGKKIHLSGRIININTAKGVTAFLMYVDNGCPMGGQCGVYVAFRGETNAGLQSMVEVYGTVRGTQDVDFAGGQKKALPAINAKYVLISSKESNK